MATAVGLDIGKFTAKAVWVRAQGRQPLVVRAEQTRLPPDAREHREMLRSWVLKVGLHNTQCVLGLPGQQCMFQPVLFAPNDARTFEQAASMEVLQFNEMAQDTMVYGFAPVPVSPGERRMLLSMARPSVLEGILGLAKDIGVRAVDLAPLPVGLYHWAAACEPAHAEPHLFINVGYSCTEIAVGTSETLMFARAFGSGGQMFTESYARAAGISSTQAEAAKVREGSLSGDSVTAKALRATAEMWLTELRACLSVYRSVYGDRRFQPVKAVLVGRGAQLGGFRELIAASIGLQTDWLKAGFGLESPDLYGPAAGLALAGAGRAISPLSLLPPNIRHELVFRKQKPFWIGAGVAASLILGVSLAGGYMDINRKKALLQSQKTSLSRRQQLAGDIEAIEKGSSAMLAMAEPVRRLVQTGPLIRDLTSAIAELIQPGDWLVRVCDADSYFAFQPAPEGDVRSRKGMRDNRRQAVRKPVERPDEISRVIVEGCTRTRNLTTVKTLISELEKKSFVEGADLLSDDQLVADAASDATAPSVRRFVIDIRIRKP